MQEEVEQKVVSLIVDCGKLGEQELKKALAKLVEQMKASHQKHQYNKENPHGKMTVKQLAAKDKGLQSIEVTDKNIGSFNRIARKYGIDFAPFKVKGENRYLVFFKAPDADAMTAVYDPAIETNGLYGNTGPAQKVQGRDGFGFFKSGTKQHIYHN